MFGGMRRGVLMCILSVRPRVIYHEFALVDKRGDVDDGVIAFRDYSLLTEKSYFGTVIASFILELSVSAGWFILATLKGKVFNTKTTLCKFTWCPTFSRVITHFMQRAFFPDPSRYD